MPEEWATWLPLIITITTLVGGAVVYNVQRAVDRREKLLEERRILYREAVQGLQESHFKMIDAKASSSERVDAILNLRTILAKIAVSCPDTVVQAANSYEIAVAGAMKHAAEVSNSAHSYDHGVMSSPDVKFRELINQMREDVFEEARIKSVHLDIGAFGTSLGIRFRD